MVIVSISVLIIINKKTLFGGIAMNETTFTKSKTFELTLTALFAALACISTMVIQIPTPTNGYVNMGDCFVLLAGFILGPVYGGLAAGIGSMLADIFSGYAYYAPATFVIKALMAVAAYFVAKYMVKLIEKASFANAAATVSAAVVAEIIMIGGYFVFAAVFLGSGLGAVAGIPGNLVQAAFAIITAPLLYALVSKSLKISLKG